MKMFVTFAVFLLSCYVALVSSDTYDRYKIYDVYTKNVLEKEVLFDLSKNSEYDFFLLSKVLEEPSRVMVQPKDQYEFESTLNNFGIEFIVVDENVGQSFDLERVQNELLSIAFDASNSKINFTSFQRYDDIYAYVDSLSKSYPSRVKVKTIGKSYEKRDLRSVTISNGDDRTNKTVILIDAGTHAREWIAPAAALYVIFQLVENFDENRLLLKNYDWVIVPLVNPDGYEYTHTKSRLWRKTRKPSRFLCVGTDPNRNFDFHWGGNGASSYSCDETFKGSKAFSETETQAIRDLMHSLADRAKLYLTLHSYGKYLLYPWGYTPKLPSTWKSIHEVAQAGAVAIKSSTGTKYRVGSSNNILYPAAGGSDDYALGAVKIPIAITMELPSGGMGFNPSPTQIEPFVSETWIGIKAMAEKVMSKY